MTWRTHDGDWFADSKRNENVQHRIYQHGGKFYPLIVQEVKSVSKPFSTLDEAKQFCETCESLIAAPDDTAEWVEHGGEA